MATTWQQSTIPLLGLYQKWYEKIVIIEFIIITALLDRIIHRRYDWLERWFCVNCWYWKRTSVHLISTNNINALVVYSRKNTQIQLNAKVEVKEGDWQYTLFSRLSGGLTHTDFMVDASSLVMTARTVNKAHVRMGIKCHFSPVLFWNNCVTIRMYKNSGTVFWSPYHWNFLKCKGNRERIFKKNNKFYDLKIQFKILMALL